jgi:amino acid transporter
MRTTYRVLAYIIAAEVVVQAMMIALGVAGLDKWVGDQGGALTKAVLESDTKHSSGEVGFMYHGTNGELVIPVLVLVLLIVSFFAHVLGGVKLAAILVGLVVLQVALGIGLHGLLWLGLLHGANAFAVLGTAVYAEMRARSVPTTGRSAREQTPASIPH